MLNDAYWQQRYENNNTGWDAGRITTPIKTYADALPKTARILIPGAGNGHEAQYLHEQGFEQVYVCDWAMAPLEDLAARCPNFPKEHLIHGDFFELALNYPMDYILEQTFFCAIDPALRPQYAKKAAELLRDGGTVAGVFFNEHLQLGRPGPPFGGSAQEYQTYFEPHFSLVQFEPCYNSIPPRDGVELWGKLVK